VKARKGTLRRRKKKIECDKGAGGKKEEEIQGQNWTSTKKGGISLPGREVNQRGVTDGKIGGREKSLETKKGKKKKVDPKKPKKGFPKKPALKRFIGKVNRREREVRLVVDVFSLERGNGKRYSQTRQEGITVEKREKTFYNRGEKNRKLIKGALGNGKERKKLKLLGCLTCKENFKNGEKTCRRCGRRRYTRGIR